jgi:AcrR family transcriptional regulator
VARTTTITNEQILTAAREVFLEQGVGATAMDVANRAGISSGSIFKRYPTKEALFFAAMSEPPKPIWNAELEAAIGHGDTRADLLLIAQRIVAYASEVLPRLMLMISTKQTPDLPIPPRIQDDFLALVGYIGREMALGRMARGDPTIPAFTLLHTATGFTMSLELASAAELFNANTFLEDFITVFWRGLDPRTKSTETEA